MLGENIRRFRREKGYSQEELAARLHVVRRTVSKWEKGLSMPDAELLMALASVLEVPVETLLGVERSGTDNLCAELARVNALLAEKIGREEIAREAGKKRGQIWLLCLMVVLAAVWLADHPVAAPAAAGALLLAVLVVLYRDLPLLTGVTTDELRMRPLRIATGFSIAVLVVGVVAAVLTAANIVTFTEHGEKMFAMLLIACVMVFAGLISPRLPFNRHTGLRLPWTVQDEDTWNIAHRILGIMSLPLAMLYVVLSLVLPDFEVVTVVCIVLWLGVPSAFSLVYYWRKTTGRL